MYYFGKWLTTSTSPIWVCLLIHFHTLDFVAVATEPKMHSSCLVLQGECVWVALLH